MLVFLFVRLHIRIVPNPHTLTTSVLLLKSLAAYFLKEIFGK
jgi:hypothetical protein